jgi:PTH2 family peptidyl-tRNA hydrolase
MSQGKMAVQVAHAAVSCAQKTSAKKPSVLRDWMQQGQKKVVVKAAEQDLYSLEKKAKSQGIITSIINDAGLTELEPGTTTAVALGPDKETLIDKITGQLPLK